MTMTQKIKFGEIIRTAIIVMSLIFGCAMGYANLKSDVEHTKTEVVEMSGRVEAVEAEQSELSTAVGILTNEVKNVNKNLVKIEAKLP